MTSLGCVVVDHVEDDFEACGVQSTNHGLELRHLSARTSRGRVGGMRREETDGVVSPIVREPFLHEKWLGQRLMHGQKLDGGDPESRQMRDDRGMCQSCIGAALMLGHIRVQAGDALDMGFVDDGVGPRCVRT